jgi:hypothetical protein
MHGLPLLQRRTERAMQTIFQIQFTAPGDNMCEQIAVEGGVLFEQRLKIEGSLCRDQLIKANLVGSDGSPLFLHVAMIWIRALVTDALENHSITLIRFRTGPRTTSRYDLAMTSPGLERHHRIVAG